jgi:hypothetical protein
MTIELDRLLVCLVYKYTHYIHFITTFSSLDLSLQTFPQFGANATPPEILSSDQ